MFMKQNRRKFLKKLFTGGITLSFFPGILSRLYGESNSALNHKPNINEWNNYNIRIAWLGHSSMLIKFYDKWILTDPVLHNRVGVYFMGSSIGPSRLTPPALTIDELPKPDIILLSHAHMDHTDYPTLRDITNKYPNQIEVVVAYFTKDVIEDLPWKKITVLDWNDESVVSGIRVKANEVKHLRWRVPWEKDRSRGYIEDGRSYNCYVIEYKDKKILFGGDTADTNLLRPLKDENIDIALMPIGAYNPWTQAHCNPEEALRMTSEIGAKVFIPMHCKTFKQGSEPFDEPIDWMNKSADKYGLKIGLDQIGQTYIHV